MMVIISFLLLWWDNYKFSFKNWPIYFLNSFFFNFLSLSNPWKPFTYHKCPLRKEGFVLAHGSRYSLFLLGRNQGSRTLRRLVTSYPVPGSRDWWMLASAQFPSLCMQPMVPAREWSHPWDVGIPTSINTVSSFVPHMHIRGHFPVRFLILQVDSMNHHIFLYFTI